MNLPVEFEGRSLTACWVFSVRINTKSNKRTAWTLYEISALSENLALYEAKRKTKNKDVISIETPILIGISYAFFTDNAEMDFLCQSQKNKLLKEALKTTHQTPTITPTINH